MSSNIDTPTLTEWILLIQEDSDRAKQHVISLKARIKKQGFMSDPSLTISVEAYDRAQQLIEAARTDPKKRELILSKMAVGRVTISHLPDHQEWIQLINTDPIFAREVCAELETKQALLSINAPEPLLRSIENYYAITEQQS